MAISKKKQRHSSKSDFSEQTDSETSDNLNFKEEPLFNQLKRKSIGKSKIDHSKTKGILSLIALVVIIVLVSSITSIMISRYSSSFSFVEDVSEVVNDLKGDLKKEREIFMKKGINFDERIQKSLGTFLNRFQENFAEKTFVVDNLDLVKNTFTKNKNEQDKINKKNHLLNKEMVEKMEKQKTEIDLFKENFKKVEKELRNVGTKVESQNLVNLEKRIAAIESKLSKMGKSEFGDDVQFVTRRDFDKVLKTIKCSKNSHEQFAKLRDGDQVDWANSQSGGHVLTTGNIYKKGIFRFRKRPMNTFISPITAVGDCYAFQPSNGYVVLGMRSPIFPTTFVYESVNADANPSSGSMPKTVKVSAVDENERLVDLSPDGNAFALKESEIRQSFELKRMEKAVKRIRVDFVENNGNKDFTCVYRIRVFGERK